MMEVTDLLELIGMSDPEILDYLMNVCTDEFKNDVIETIAKHQEVK